MRGRIALAAACVSALSLGLTASPAAAQLTSSVSTTVVDAATSQPWSDSEVTGASAFDTATLTVSGPIPTGTVTYTLFSTSTSCTGPSTTQVVTLNGDGTVPNSSTTSTLGAGSYSYEASYSGDSNYDASGQSTCEPFSVLQATPSISTKVFDASTNTHWSGTETTGATAYDTASIEGTVAGFVPTGTVTYTLFSTSTSCTGPSTTQVVTLNGDGTVPNSSTTSTLGAGSYSYEASYSGDSNYDASGQSTCEPFSVLQATPSISTKVFDASTNTHWSGTETTGATAYDTASIEGTVAGFVPTGTVTYTLFSTSTSCTGPSTTQVVTLNGDGTVPNSATTAALTAGGYSFQANYSGDLNYSPSPLGACEPFSVGLASSSLSTSVFDAATNSAWSGSEVTGASAFDTATVSVSGPTPTGTVTYSYFAGSTTCSGTPASTQVVDLNPNGSVPDSATTAVLTAGGYSFQASYSGDSDYSPSPLGACEPFSVGLASSSLSTSVVDAATSLAWSGSEVTGASAYDTANVTSGTGVAIPPGGTVAYSYYQNNTCTGGPTATDVVTLSGGSVPVSTSQGPLGHGSYSFRASYSGDQNYRAAPLGACEPFSVAKAGSTLSATVFDASTNLAWTNTELTGAAAYDTTLSLPGNDGVTPTGTVTYTLYTTTESCSGPNATPVVVTLGDDGVVPPSSTTSPLDAGVYSFSALYSGDGNYRAAAISCEPFSVAQAGAPPVTIANIPSGVVYGGSFTPEVQTISDGAPSVTSMTPGVCALNGSAVDYVGVGTCTLVAQTAGTANYAAGTGSPQSFSVGLATPTSPAVTNFPRRRRGVHQLLRLREHERRWLHLPHVRLARRLRRRAGRAHCHLRALRHLLAHGQCGAGNELPPGNRQRAELPGRCGPPRVLARRLRRRHLLVRVRRVPRLHGWHSPPTPGRRHHAHRGPERLLARCLRRRDLQLRRLGLLRLHPRCRAAPRRLGVARQPRCADRRHGALEHRPRVLHGGLGRRRLRLRRRTLRGLVSRHRRVLRVGGVRHARQLGQRLLARDQQGRRLRLRRRARLRLAAARVGARRQRGGHARRARLLDPVLQRRRLLRRRRRGHGRTGRVCEFVQPGHRDLPDGRRPWLLGGRGQRGRLLLRRRPVHGEHGGSRTERPDHRWLRLLARRSRAGSVPLRLRAPPARARGARPMARWATTRTLATRDGRSPTQEIADVAGQRQGVGPRRASDQGDRLGRRVQAADAQDGPTGLEEPFAGFEERGAAPAQPHRKTQFEGEIAGERVDRAQLGQPAQHGGPEAAGCAGLHEIQCDETL